MLSPRQREIVTLVGRDGLSYLGVARTLGISVHTVRTHVRAVVERANPAAKRKPREVLVKLYYAEVAHSGE